MKIHNKLFAFIITSFFCLTTFAGCSLSFDSMLDAYNEQFLAVEEKKRVPVPGDADFVPETMLRDKYIVANDATLILAGPAGATSYSWQIFSMEDNTEINYFKARGGYQNANFVIYIPTTPLKAGKSYKLMLTVGDGFGRKYSDSTKIIIYED